MAPFGVYFLAAMPNTGARSICIATSDRNTVCSKVLSVPLVVLNFDEGIHILTHPLIISILTLERLN